MCTYAPAAAPVTSAVPAHACPDGDAKPGRPWACCPVWTFLLCASFAPMPTWAASSTKDLVGPDFVGLSLRPGPQWAWKFADLDTLDGNAQSYEKHDSRLSGKGSFPVAPLRQIPPLFFLYCVLPAHLPTPRSTPWPLPCICCAGNPLSDVENLEWSAVILDEGRLPEADGIGGGVGGSVAGDTVRHDGSEPLVNSQVWQPASGQHAAGAHLHAVGAVSLVHRQDSSRAAEADQPPYAWKLPPIVPTAPDCG